MPAKKKMKTVSEERWGAISAKDRHPIVFRDEITHDNVRSQLLAGERAIRVTITYEVRA